MLRRYGLTAMVGVPLQKGVIMTATMATEFLLGAGSQAAKLVMVANLDFADGRRHPGLLGSRAHDPIRSRRRGSADRA